jgi:hypothetical protein
MEMTERVKLIFDKADLIEDKKHARDLVGDILGTEGQKFYINLETQGKNLNEVLSSAKNHIFTDIESQSNAMMFNSEIKALKNTIGEISSLTGSELGEVFTPMVKGINDFLEANNQLISSGIKTFFEDLQDLSSEVADGFEKVGSAFSKMLQTMTNSDTLESALEKIYNNFLKFTKDTNSLITDSFVNTFDFFEKLFSGDFKGAFESWQKFYSDANKNVSEMFETKNQDFELNEVNKTITQTKQNRGKAKYEELPDFTKDLIARYYNEFGELTGINVKDIGNYKSDIEERIKIINENMGMFDSNGNKIKFDNIDSGVKSINDGIVKPNGEVINISPDDWVFAMKDPSNLSKGNENIIPKEININERESKFIYEKQLEKNINNFMPQNVIDPSFIKSVLPRTITGNTNTINENITVNQTFNVQGGSNIPQTIRQQAQKGVYDGVGELIQKSTTRLQLMSGIK